MDNVVIYQNDHLGTPHKLTEVNGAVVWSAKHSSFGEAGVYISSTIENNLRFAGQYYDEETGLHYNYFRYYDAKTGRYLTPDPIGLAGGINPYLYVLNNPINQIDPFGLRGRNLAEYWTIVEHYAAPFAVGIGAIISGAWTGAAGIVLTGASAAAIPATFGISAVGIPVGVLVTAAGGYQVMFGTTVIVNQLNALFTTNIPTLSDYSQLFPAYPPQHTGRAHSVDVCED